MTNVGTIANRVYTLTAPGRVEILDAPLPGLPPDRVRVRYLYSGICGSDLSAYHGHGQVRLPATIGHEFIAVVEAAGADVDGVFPGDVITSDLNFRCGACDRCLNGRSHVCRSGQIGDFTNRAFAQRGDLHHSYLERIDAAPAPHLALAEPLSCALHALDWARIAPTDRVLVVGAGGIGLCTAFGLQHHSARPPFDIADTNAERLAAILETVGSAPDGLADEYDVVLDVSGSESGLAFACDKVAPCGRLATMSHLPGSPAGAFLLGALTRRDVTFTVSYLNGPRSNLTKAAQLLVEGWSPSWDRLIEVVPADQLPAVYEGRPMSTFCKTILDLAPLQDVEAARSQRPNR